MAKAKDLAGLAALGYLGYKLSQQGKGDTTSTRAARPESTETRKDEGPTADKKTKSDVLEAITKPKEKANDAAGNQGVLGGNKPASRSMPKIETKADAEDKATTTSTRTTPGGDAKRTEGSKPMPSLRAVESRAAARNDSISTDAMKNTSRAQQAGINRQKAMRANPEAQAVERVYPEENLIGGPGIKVVGAAAKNLANRGAKEIAEYSTPLLRGPAAQTATPRLGGPTPQLTGPSKTDLMARDRAVRASSRQEEMLRENARRSGLDPDNINPAVANKVRENMGGADFSLGMKKGGKVKRMASGGMASGGMTASRRGDGIATKGKTRGRIC